MRDEKRIQFLKRLPRTHTPETSPWGSAISSSRSATKNAEARKKFEQHDYAGTVAVLEAIRLTRERDEELYRQAKGNQKRLLELKKEIAPRVIPGPHEGLLDLVEEYLRLLPKNAEMIGVRDRLRKLEAAKQPKAGSIWENTLKRKFVRVPAGSFWMGGGGGQPGDRQVKIPHDFYIGMHAVTQGEWQGVMRSNPSHFSRKGDGKDKVKRISDEELKEFPVENVSWEDVQKFIEKLNAKEKNSGWVCRLPTAAEREYSVGKGLLPKKSVLSTSILISPPMR